MNKVFEIRCAGDCKRLPKEIGEYVEGAIEENMTPDQYVRNQEGTYNPWNGHFYCTSCYIKLGMPNGIAK
jgi:hypothetical protein